MKDTKEINSFFINKLDAITVENMLTRYLDSVENIVIYGAMQIGMKIKDIVKGYCNKNVLFFDEYMTFDVLDNIPVYHNVEALSSIIKRNKTVFVCSAALIKSLHIQENKVREYFPESDIIDKSVLFFAHYKGEINIESDSEIKSICTLVTNLCSLRCKGCSLLIPQVVSDYRRNFELDELCSDVDRISSISGLIDNFEILGGEPLLHKELDKYIYHVRNHKNILYITLITNGTIIPDERVLKALKDCDIVVRISDYGDYSSKKNELSNLLSDFGILNFMRSAIDFPWIDYGEFKDCGNDGKMQHRMCRDRGSYVMYDGGLYPCGRMFRQIEQGLYEKNKADYVDLYGDTTMAKHMLSELYMNGEEDIRPFYGCRYCGVMEKTIEAGVQI